ncbi:glutamate--tRNA ligase [Actinospica robiniae]|uniref:glutamate--tRNA ligase n=1 Tax=Actinospica robiniae TaxID=304901 RepID=UPI0007C4EE20|nr:glutamate--tRNA ligase [Actinospica robiniae]
MSIDTSKLDNSVRVRFPPSPTGDPHVGLVRSALFNYAFARHYGGKLVLRIEDTDAARNTEESYQAILQTLRWMGLEWDEGPEVGGEHGPYRQSERGEIYQETAARLKEGGFAYPCYCTAEELEAARERAKEEKRNPGYEGTCRNLTADQIAAYEADGRTHVLRFRMPDRQIAWNDLVRGEISFEAENVPDYPLLRADGSPLYALTNPVDDAMMAISHVLRGEDLLPSTPRQIPLHEALVELGVSKRVPEFGHLPFVMGEGNKKLSKRDPQASFSFYPRTGYLPEGVLNYLALLGWSLGNDEEIFTKEDLVAGFDGTRINSSPARFDLKKCEAINAVHLRKLETQDLAKRILPFLDREGLLLGGEDGHLADDAEWRTLLAATPLVQERMTVLSEAVPMLGFLFTGDGTDRRHKFQVNEDDAAKVLTADAWPALAAATAALEAIGVDGEGSAEAAADAGGSAPSPSVSAGSAQSPHLPQSAQVSESAEAQWTTQAIDDALRAALIEGLGLKPKNAFTPIRVAITGRRVSPPLFESIELLGRDRALARLRAATARARAAASAAVS